MAMGSPSWPTKAFQGTIPRARVEKEIAKIKTVKMREMEVRGTMVAGRRVS
jgi:hypothetical protein